MVARLRPARDLSGVVGTINPAGVLTALGALEVSQVLGKATRAIHAAALWSEMAEIIVREDVGRHNALDKLIGACAVAGRKGDPGILMLTSRLSVEMIQKAEILGAPIVCAMSAPTALAVRAAERAGITLIGVARPDGFEIFNRPDRVVL
ncbi:MAG: hypothetical protein EON93_23830 [Burkholderiales bacterium]|nr:MAG: hypothetical protein EON93_23830 [Burkholderiales bacterium]